MEYTRTPLAEIIGHYGIKGIHPSAELLPMASDEEFQVICADVKTNGFLHPIHIDKDDLLIDGRNRLQAAWTLGIKPQIKRFQPTDVLAYVLSENIARHHLTAGQRAMLATKIANLHIGRQQMFQLEHLELTQEQASKQFNTTRVQVSKARVVKEWAPAEARKIEAGTLELNTGYRIARENRFAAERKEKPGKKGSDNGSGAITLTGIVDKKRVEIPYPRPKPRHQFNRTNDAVDWASWTWNPVTGCLHGCKYCHARELAYRDSYRAAYPIKFAPLFHHERLDDPVNTVPGTDRPQDGRVFVCSMADLFGEWVRQDWIDSVFEATLRAPEWEYLFLTKFPQRYRRINLPPKAWFGASVDMQKRVKVTEKFMANLDVSVRWISVEPMLEPLVFNDLSWCDLIVIGAQSETHQPDGFVPAFAPQLEWVIDLISQARAWKVPV